jgi:histidinol-phosphate aminotransferase
MSDPRIARLIRPEIRALKAYGVAEPEGLIKLDAMENPYRWPQTLRAAWLKELGEAPINRYPDPQARRLKDRLRAAMGVPAGMELLLGNGSDELIEIILLALARPGTCVLAPTPTFVMYELLANVAGLRFVGVPLGADFALDLPAMLTAIERDDPAVIFLAYPNNPTGNLYPQAEVEAVLRAARGLVVLDEAYHAFAGASFMTHLKDFDNLLVMRTVSKQGLAGLRLGLLAGAPDWLAEFDKLRLPYNINVLTQISVDFALRHADVLEAQAAQLRHDRETLFAALSHLPDVRVWPSRANFLLFKTLGRSAREVFEELQRRGVLIRNLDKPGTALEGCLRVTIGTPEENDAFLAALAGALAA